MITKLSESVSNNDLIGVFNANGNELIPQSNYLVITDFEDAYDVYSDLMQREFKF